MYACVTTLRSGGSNVAAIAPLLATAISASAQLQPIGSFQDMPGGVFYNVWNPSPCGQHYWYPFTIDVAGIQVTVTPLGSTPPAGFEDGPYSVGCFGWSSSSHDYWRVPPDPAVDPGDYTGNYETAAAPFGDLILDFSEPLTAFGFSSWVGRPCSSGHNPGDTALLYDGLHATGNLLGSISTSHSLTSCFFTIDFVGLVGDTPQIRSVRIPVDSPGGIFVDGIAISVEQTCAFSLSEEPAPVTSCGRTPATFVIQADGSPPYSYQWRKDGLPLSDGPTGAGSTIQGSDTETLTILNATTGDEGLYDCQVTGACGSTVSSAATLTVCTANLNDDLVVDLADYQRYYDCQTGPGGIAAGGCECADADGDNDVDLADHASFQVEFLCPQ